MREEQYEAQIKYAKMLRKGLDISRWHPIQRFRAFKEAEDFRESHKNCCEWAREDY